LRLQSFQQLPALMGKPPLPRFNSNNSQIVREIGIGARLDPDFCHAISVFL